jgi:N-acetylmuramoyl-L-alanine amidase
MAETGSRALTALVIAGVLGLAGCAADAPRPALAPAPPRSSPTPLLTPSPTPSSRATPGPMPSTPATPRPTNRPSARPPRTVAGPMVVIDPGHSGQSIRSTDAATGLHDIDYPNYPEIYEMFDVSSCVAAGLRTDGYRVRLTKAHALDSVGLAARARVANQAHAALAISVHDDHSQGPGFEATYSQRGVRHGGAYHPMYRGTGSRRTVYRNATVAKASERAAAVLARERASAQGRPVSVRENIYTGRPPLEPGNLALVQLLADVPWVYNEMGAKTRGSTTRAMSIASETAYATGLLRGVEAAVPPGGKGGLARPSAGSKGLRSCLVDRVEPSRGHFTRPTRYLPDGF